MVGGMVGHGTVAGGTVGGGLNRVCGKALLSFLGGSFFAGCDDVIPAPGRKPG